MTFSPPSGAGDRLPGFPPPHRPAGRLSRLSPGQKAGLYIGAPALAFILLCCGGLTVIGALSGDPKTVPAAEEERHTTAAAPPPTTPPAIAAATPSPTPARSAAVIEKRTVTETRSIPFSRRTVKDPSLPRGTTRLRTRGAAGVKTLTYEVTVTDGVQTGRRLLREVTTKRPVAQVTAVGTKTARRCHPNYSGCVPIARDVDCAGGSGDGPAYVNGPVTVTGKDIYRLDNDNDGVACE